MLGVRARRAGPRSSGVITWKRPVNAVVTGAQSPPLSPGAGSNAVGGLPPPPARRRRGGLRDHDGSLLVPVPKVPP
jgi:hypothetical protein